MPSAFQLREAAHALKHGEIIAYPSEAVYGLGCRPDQFSAVAKLLELKSRDIRKGLILVASDWKQLNAYIQPLSRSEQQHIEQHSDTTWLVDKHPQCPFWISGAHNKVAIRLSQHPIIKTLCTLSQSAMTSTSANPSSAPSATTYRQVKRYFPHDLGYTINGALGDLDQATRICDLKSGEFFR